MLFIKETYCFQLFHNLDPNLTPQREAELRAAGHKKYLKIQGFPLELLEPITHSLKNHLVMVKKIDLATIMLRFKKDCKQELLFEFRHLRDDRGRCFINLYFDAFVYLLAAEYFMQQTDSQGTLYSK